ncbi:MAG: integration host factor subunit beta [Myxococcales bacterium]|nr:integration host factor subunit beta [Myxococcales bacterium]
MTKSELIDAVAARGELTKARAELVVNCVFDTIIAALLREEGVEIRGFGSVTVRPYKPYEGRNPRTGAPVDVPAKRLPFFKVGKELRELVNGSRHLAITGDEQPRRVLARTEGRVAGGPADGVRASTPPWSSLPRSSPRRRAPALLVPRSGA